MCLLYFLFLCLEFVSSEWLVIVLIGPLIETCFALAQWADQMQYGTWSKCHLIAVNVSRNLLWNKSNLLELRQSLALLRLTVLGASKIYHLEVSKECTCCTHSLHVCLLFVCSTLLDELYSFHLCTSFHAAWQNYENCDFVASWSALLV